MNLLCGQNSTEPNNDTFFQFEEGKRANTIKFIPDIMKLNLKAINNIKISKQNLKNQKFNNEILIKNKNPKESNKCSNNASELEIIEYPINELKQNDLKNINDMITTKAKDYINDKSQNDILDYLGLNYLNLLLENDKYSYNSKNINNENDENSSKSDEIICSYVEIDHNNSIISRRKKEKSAIKQSPKIFSQIHQATYSDYSLSIKKDDLINNKALKTINVDKSKNKNDEKRIKVNKNFKKVKTDMKFKKKINQVNPSINKAHGHLKNNQKKTKEEGIKSFLDIMPKNENNKISDINNHYKKKIIFEKKLKLETFKSIEYLNNINPLHINYKNALNTNKLKKSSGKSQIINSERSKTNFQLNKNVNTKSRDKNYTHIYKYVKGSLIKSKSKSKNKINSKGKTIQNENPLFNSITINKNLNIKKGGNYSSLKKNLLSSMRIDSKNKLKTGNKNTTLANSKSKLRKLLINNPNNSKHKCDLSMYNIKSINNNLKSLRKKEKNKTLSKIMNKSEINKKINNSIQFKNNNNEGTFKNNLRQTSISKILKG